MCNNNIYIYNIRFHCGKYFIRPYCAIYLSNKVSAHDEDGDDTSGERKRERKPGTEDIHVGQNICALRGRL